MSAQRGVRTVGITVAVMALGVSALAVAMPAETGSAAAQRISPSGVGAVKLGKSFQQLRQQGLVGILRRGCELSGPNARSARLLAPLKGSVDFTTSSPRRVKAIIVRGGARARGVGIGAKIPRIKAAFPTTKVDHSTDQTFGITLVKVPAGGGGRLQFAVSTNSKRTTLIGVPRVPFCE